MKPTISRAMATLTTLAVLPRALSRRYRVQSRSCALQAMSRTTFGRASIRSTLTTDARLHSVSPGAFDQRASGMGVAGLGDAAASDGLAARLLSRDQAEIGHELAGVCKACEIAHFSDQHYGCDQSDTPHRLQGINNWAQIPFGK